VTPDTEDRLRAVEQSISTHEAVCAERYEHILKAHEQFHDKLESTTSVLVKIGLALLGGMAMIFAKLVVHL